VDSDPRLPEAADVVVIGAGTVGVAAACSLAGQGHFVAQPEKGIGGGEQSSGSRGWCGRKENAKKPRRAAARRLFKGWSTLSPPCSVRY
jgi:glycine/D-amino acid oxidase-like deaminating enzyme